MIELNKFKNLVNIDLGNSFKPKSSSNGAYNFIKLDEPEDIDEDFLATNQFKFEDYDTETKTQLRLMN